MDKKKNTTNKGFLTGFKNSKLSAKIIFFVTVISLIAVAMISFTVFNSVKLSLQKTISENQLGNAERMMSTLDRTLYERYSDITIISGSEIFRLLLESNKDANADFDHISEAAELRINNFNNTFGLWDIIFLVDINGKIALSTDEEEIGEDVFEEPNSMLAYQAAMRGEVYYSDLVISDDTGKPTIIFSAPIKNNNEPDQPIIGAVIGNYSWQAFSEILEKNPDLAHLYNSQGIVIGSNDKEHQKGILIESHQDKIAIQHVIESQSNMSMILDSVHGDFESLTSYVKQQGYLDYKGSGWALIIETPVKVAFAPAVQAAWRAVLVLIPIVAVLIFVILILITRFIIKPINNLSNAAQAIAAGDLTKRAEIKSKDEIGLLGESFNQMVENLLGAEKYNRNLIEASLDPLVTISEKGKITDVNEATVKAIGFSRDKLIGTDFSNYFTDPDKARAGYKEVLSKGSVRNYPLTIIHKNGQLTPVSYNASVYKDEKGKIKGVFAAARDVTEVKKYAANRLSEITPVLQKISMGDFSQNIKISKEEDEFTEHLVALNLMIDDLRETVGKNAELVKALEKEKASLEQKVKERTVSVDAANQQLKAGNQQLEAANQQLAASQKNLQDKLLELERFNKVAVGRELKMVELKEEIKRLKSKEQ